MADTEPHAIVHWLVEAEPGVVRFRLGVGPAELEVVLGPDQGAELGTELLKACAEAASREEGCENS
jgi:hypothetical protein